jgi:hypothetical protein
MPTLPQKIEAIRQACIAANKSILDLKMGCKVFMGDDTQEPCIVTIGNPYEVTIQRKVSNPWNRDDTSDLLEIIGRDILLSDVMAAIGRKYGDDGFATSWIVHGSCLANNGRCYWNLLRPSLDDQEEATVNLIYEILCTME